MDDGLKRDLVELLDAVQDAVAGLTEEVIALGRRVDALDAKAEKPEGEEPDWSFVVPGWNDTDQSFPSLGERHIDPGWKVRRYMSDHDERMYWRLYNPDGAVVDLLPGDKLFVRDGRFVVERKGE